MQAVQQNIGKQVSGFFDFIRERGVAGLAIGFVMGSAVQKVVTAFVADIINPLVGFVSGSSEKLSSFTVGPFAIGDFLSTLIDFLILAAVIYFFFKVLKIEAVDKPKS